MSDWVPVSSHKHVRFNTLGIDQELELPSHQVDNYGKELIPWFW